MKCIAGYWWISQYNFIPRNTCTASCLILFARNIQFYRKGHMPCLVWRIFLCMLKGGSCVYSITVLQFYSAHGCSRRVVLWNMLLVSNIEVSIHSAEEFCEQFSHLCERESKFFCLGSSKQTRMPAVLRCSLRIRGASHMGLWETSNGGKRNTWGAPFSCARSLALRGAWCFYMEARSILILRLLFAWEIAWLR